MRIMNHKKVLRKFLFSITSTAFIIGFAFLTVKLLPHAVEYTPKEAQNSTIATEAVSVETAQNCKYQKLDLIQENGPFIIKSYGDGIYVMKGDTYLYRICAKLSDFPKSDKQEISKGIYAKNLSELYEIAAYLES